MRIVELLILAYCAYLAILMVVRPVPRERRWRTGLLLGTMVAAVVVGAFVAPLRPALALVRDWLPAVCILLGYWASGAFFVAPMAEWERRLVDVDRRLSRCVPRLGALDALLELAYLSVYLVIPAGFASVYWHRQSLDVDRYWTLVVLSEFACYAMLPWIQTRPPRIALSDQRSDHASRVRRMNLTVLDRGSIQANTFPSAHAAGAVATGLAVMASRPAAGLFFLVWAALIAAGSVTGRYHYAADAILGAALAVAIWSVVSR